MATVKRYNLAQIVYEGKQITTDTFKTTRKIDTEEYTASNDYNKATGDLVEDDAYGGAYITEISKENANKPFSVKGGATKKIKI